MITFFTILFIIVGVNAVMLFINFNSIGQKKKLSTDSSATAASEVYPIDLISSKYKKAV